MTPAWLLVVPLVACDGSDEGGDDAPGQVDYGTFFGRGEGDGGGEAPEPFCDEAVRPGPMPGLGRLTHTQYDNTVRALLGMDAAPSESFLDDPVVGVFDNDASALFVTGRLVRDYMRAAEELAAMAVADEERMQALVPCDPEAGDACASLFIETFGRRAFRRPLDDEELERYILLFERGAGLFDEGSTFARGVRIVIEAMLQSPSFLYRQELGRGVRALDGWEIASRLSYLLWSSAPDDELLDAAEAGDLDHGAGIAAAARRMLDDPRARDAIDDFHRQWLELDRYGGLTKNPDAFPEWSPDIERSLREEVLQFVRRVVFELDGSYVDLLTLPETYVDADLAKLYGVQGDFGDGMELVELDADERAGLLTQIGFLASHAHAAQTSPIHRGVFLQRRVLCNPLPDPPGDVDPSIPAVGGDIDTTREAVEIHTADAACSGCHAVINEPGFSFEGYDAIGRTRSEENGHPIDSTGSILLGTERVPFNDAVELSNAIAYSEAGPRCYATQWFRYANMRKETSNDACTLDGVHEAWAGADYQIDELLVALTQTASFRYRAEQEDLE